MIAPKLSHKKLCSIFALNDASPLLKRVINASIFETNNLTSWRQAWKIKTLFRVFLRLLAAVHRLNSRIFWA